jgi:DNA-binding GntR family transcriptional regulator
VPIDREGKLPLYQQIANELRRDIAAGRYAAGRRLPSETELAAHYEVNRLTVRKGIALLVEEGLCEKVPGRGTFVSEDQAALSARSA